MNCPECIDGIMEKQIRLHSERVNGVAIIIKDANFLGCDTCGKFMISIDEYKRWEKISENFILESGK